MKDTVFLYKITNSNEVSLPVVKEVYRKIGKDFKQVIVDKQHPDESTVICNLQTTIIENLNGHIAFAISMVGKETYTTKLSKFIESTLSRRLHAISGTEDYVVSSFEVVDYHEVIG